jgi:hypothetical protein
MTQDSLKAAIEKYYQNAESWLLSHEYAYRDKNRPLCKFLEAELIKRGMLKPTLKLVK